MSKFNVGDKVRGISADIVGCEGIIEKITDHHYALRITKVGNRPWHGKGDFAFGALNTRGFWEACLEKIGEAPKTFGMLETGDVLIDEDGDERMVLGVCGSICFLSEYNTFDIYQQTVTIKELKKLGYTIKQPTQETKVETIDLMGKTYAKSDIENALKDVKPLN